nr:membrane-spanning 4-domains subfamily A member 12-like [Chelonoidis abingdonii]
MEEGPSGVILLTQIIPQPHSSDSSALLRPLQKFYQGEPLALGITQIFTGIVLVAFGIILTLANEHHLIVIQMGTPFWTGILYIISGIICVEAAKNPKISLMRALLGMNILSAIVTGGGIIFYSLSFAFYYPYTNCQWIKSSQSCTPISHVPTIETLSRLRHTESSFTEKLQGSVMATTMTASSAGPITIINKFITQPHTASAANPAKLQPLEKFYKGEPLALGITQIVVGAVQLAVGVMMAMVSSYFWILALSVHVPIWSGLLYIISGALSVAAAKNPKIPLVKGSLGMNIISSVLAGCAMILYLISLIESRYQSICVWYPEKCITDKVTTACIAVLLLFTFLEFFVSISTVAFGCKTICRNSYSEVSVVIYQNVVAPDDPTTATNTHTDAVACTPPPYKDLATP